MPLVCLAQLVVCVSNVSESGGAELGLDFIGRFSSLGTCNLFPEIYSTTEVELSSPRSLPKPAEMVPFRPCCQGQTDEICVGKRMLQAVLRAALPCSRSPPSGGLKCRVSDNLDNLDRISTLDTLFASFCTGVATGSSLFML